MSRVEVNTKGISDGQVTTSDLANGAVTASKIANPLASLTVNSLTAGGLAFPTSDGANGHVLTTDGDGSLSFSSAASSSQTLSVIARSSTVSVTITSGILPVVARSGTINVGVS
jgi:hypothetical protein